MKTVCSYHPTTSAHFECHECGTAYCYNCIIKRPFEQYGKKTDFYLCPKCNVEAFPLGVGNLVEPFWKRLHEFFLYPLKFQPLCFIFVIAGFNLFFPAAFLINLAFTFMILKYSLLVLNNTALGKLTPPEITLEAITSDMGQVVKQFFIIVLVIMACVFVSGYYGPLIGGLFVVVAILCLPAMIMGLVATGQLLSALNPLVITKIISGIGGAYFLMYLFLVFLLGAPAALITFTSGFLPDLLTSFIFLASKNFYMVMAYNLMGYVLLQYHQEIGYEVDYEKFIGQGSKSKESPHDRLLGEVSVLIKEGKIDAAIEAIRTDTRGEFKDARVAERYFNLLKMKKVPQDIIEHGNVFLEMLVKEKKKNKTLEVYKDCLAIDPKYVPYPEVLFKIAEWLAWGKEPKEALNLLILFTKKYPKDPALPNVYFFLAKFLHTRMNNNKKAKEVLRFLTKKYPEDDVAVSAEKYLSQMA